MSAMVSASRTCSAPARTSTMDVPPTGSGAWRCGSITTARGGWRSFARLADGIKRHGEELEAMLDQPVAKPRRDVALQFLDLLVAELDDAAGLQVDEVVVMVGRHLLVARAPVAEIMARQDVRLLEQAHRAVHRGNADLGIDLVGAAVDGLDIGMIGRVRQHACDDAALLGHLQALIKTELFEPRGHPYPSQFSPGIIAQRRKTAYRRLAGPAQDAGGVRRRWSAGRACRDRSPWRACCAGEHSWAPPWGSRAAGPSARDNRPASCHRRS